MQSHAATRFRRGRLILKMLDAASGPAGDRWRAERAELWQIAQDTLPYVVKQSVEMPMVHGLDVGPRIVYDTPPPYEHVIEYVQAAANGYSFDDPRGWYEAELASPPFDRIRAYQAAIADFSQRWGLTEPWAQRMIIHAHVRAVAASDLTTGETALDDLAGTTESEDPALEPEVQDTLRHG